MARIIDARVRQKAATLEEWNNSDLDSLDGEQLFVRSDVDDKVIGFKLGARGKKFSELDYPDFTVRGKVSPTSTWAGRQSGVYIPTSNGVYNGVTVNLSEGYQVLYWDGNTIEKVVYPADYTSAVFGGAIDDSKDLSTPPTEPTWYIALPGDYNTTPPITLTENSILTWDGNEWSHIPFELEIRGEFLVADNIAEVRNITPEVAQLLVNGTYKGVEVLGYYEKGDTPAPIIYYLSDTADDDDGGSVLVVGDIKLEHDFQMIFDIRYFGCKLDNLFDNSDILQNILNNHLRGKLIFPVGVTAIYKTVYIPNGSQIIFQGQGRNSGNGAPFGVADGLSMITWLGEDTAYTEAIVSQDPDNCWCEFNNIHINNRTSRQDVDGLVLYKFIRGVMNDCVIARFKTNLLIQNWSYYMSLYNCQFSYGHDANVSLLEQSNHASFNSCRFLLSTGDGFRINNGQTGVTFNSCYFEQNKKSAINCRNSRVININNCYFEQNGTQGDKTTSNVSVHYYDNNDDVDTIVNIYGGYAYFRDGIDFVRVMPSPNNNFGDINVNIFGTAFTARNFLQDKSTTPASQLSALIRVVTAGSGLISKVSVCLENNGNIPASNGLGIILPISGRPADYKSFRAYNCNVTKTTRPEWDDSTKEALRENLRATNINFLGNNGDVETNKFVDFPSLITADGYYNFGRNTNNSGNLRFRLYNNSSLTSWLDAKTGEGVFNKLRLGSGTNNPTINYHTTNPEGVITATTGSLCLVTGVTGNNVYHKSTGTGNTGWVLLTPPPNATPTTKGLVNQGVAVPDGSSIDTLLASLRAAGIIET